MPALPPGCALSPLLALRLNHSAAHRSPGRAPARTPRSGHAHPAGLRRNHLRRFKICFQQPPDSVQMALHQVFGQGMPIDAAQIGQFQQADINPRRAEIPPETVDRLLAGGSTVSRPDARDGYARQPCGTAAGSQLCSISALRRSRRRSLPPLFMPGEFDRARLPEPGGGLVCRCHGAEPPGR